MLAEVEQTMDLSNLDKSDWKSYRFDEIAHNISERIDPNNTDLEVYIGLEHIDSESIHIKRFGTRDDVNGQKLRFYPGDVIFGRRRAYQRKAGIAETDGFCSAHALVLRANPDVIDSMLFPFFLHSDAFMHRAVDISVGSLSPTINWGTLKKQEFLLPPKAKHAKLAELLWTMDDVLESNCLTINHCENLKASVMKKFSTGGVGWRKMKIKDLVNFEYGKALKDVDRNGGDYPVVSSSGIQGFHDDYLVSGPGIIVGRKGNVGEVTWVEQNYWPIDTAYYIKIHEQYSSLPKKLFFYLLKAVNFKRLSIATAVPGLNRDDALLSDVFFPLPGVIDELLREIEVVEAAILKLREKKALSTLLHKNLINQVF